MAIDRLFGMDFARKSKPKEEPEEAEKPEYPPLRKDPKDAGRGPFGRKRSDADDVWDGMPLPPFAEEPGSVEKRQHNQNLLTAVDKFDALYTAYQNYDPFFFTIQGKARLLKAQTADRIGAASEEDIEIIDRYNDMINNAGRYFVQEIHDNIGAQMTAAERRLMRSYVPDKGDGPEQFLRKIQNALIATSNVILRISYAAFFGVDAADLVRGTGFEYMEQTIAERYNELWDFVISKGISEADARKLVAAEMEREFGEIYNFYLSLIDDGPGEPGQGGQSNRRKRR